MSSIFPGLVSDASNLILSFCDAGSLVQLSGVNKEASQTLSNGTFFEGQYSDRHPHLKPFYRLFTVLRSHHPSNCWKVICQILDPDWLQKGFNLPSLNYGFAEKASSAFIDEAIPHALAALNEEKDEWGQKLKNICGSYYADPNSPIDKAWKGYQESKHLLEQIEQRIVELKESLRAFHSEEEIDEILHELFWNYDNFLSLSEEGFSDLSDEERKGMDPVHFPLYRKLAEVCSQANPLVQDGGNKLGSYNVLEVRRKAFGNKIREVEHMTAAFLKSPVGSHMSKLSGEWDVGLGLERALENQPHLEDCFDLIIQLIDHPEERKPAVLESIRRSINACTDEYRILIWRALYVQCAGGVIEDSWAENHFQDFLLPLKYIVIDRLAYALHNRIYPAENHLKY